MNPIEIKFGDDNIIIKVKKPIIDDINIKIDADGNVIIIPKKETSNISRECETENVERDSIEELKELFNASDFDLDLD